MQASRPRDDLDSYLGATFVLKPPTPWAPTQTDGFIDELATEEEFNSLVLGKVTLSQPEQLDIPNLTDHDCVRCFRKNDKGFFDYVSETECHEIAREPDGKGGWKYTKTTKIPTDSIHMSNP